MRQQKDLVECGHPMTSLLDDAVDNTALPSVELTPIFRLDGTALRFGTGIFDCHSLRSNIASIPLDEASVNTSL
jgi:hypothetical protein